LARVSVCAFCAKTSTTQTSATLRIPSQLDSGSGEKAAETAQKTK
jgi:hypothetical protein